MQKLLSLLMFLQNHHILPPLLSKFVGIGSPVLSTTTKSKTQRFQQLGFVLGAARGGGGGPTNLTKARALGYDLKPIILLFLVPRDLISLVKYSLKNKSFLHNLHQIVIYHHSNTLILRLLSSRGRFFDNYLIRHKNIRFCYCLNYKLSWFPCDKFKK